MFGPDDASAAPSGSMPAIGAVGPNPNGWFQEGIPGTGTLATKVAAEFLNIILMEFRNLLSYVGLSENKAQHDQLLQAILLLGNPVGTIIYRAAPNAPSGYLYCDGSAVSRSTYSRLFQLLVTDQGFTPQSFTVTIASPGIFTKVAHGFTGNERLRLATTGTLPGGLTTGVDYFVDVLTADTFRLAATPYGAHINTTGTQSGTHTYTQSLWGLGDGVNTFNLPDLRNEFLRGWTSGRAFGTWEKGSVHSIDHGATISSIADRNQTLAGASTALSYMGLDAVASGVIYNTATRVATVSGVAEAAIANDSEAAFGAVRPRNMAAYPLIKF